MSRAAATAVAVFVCGSLSIAGSSMTGGMAAIWPANAIVVAAGIGLPTRRWPLLWLAGFAGTLLVNLSDGTPGLVAFGLAGCNAIEIAICAIGLRWLVGSKPDLFRRRDFMIFAPLCFIAALASALIAMTMLTAHDHRSLPRALTVWTLADGLGLLILTPALLGITPDALRKAFTPSRRWRTVAAVVGLVVIECSVFLAMSLQPLVLISAALIVFVFELEALGAALGMVITAVITVGFTVAGHGPAVLLHLDRATQVLTIQAFLALSAVLNLAVAGTLAQRRQFKEALAESEIMHRMIAENANDIIVRANVDGVILYASPSVRQLGYEPVDLVGSKTDDFIHPEDQLTLDERRDRATRRQDDQEYTPSQSRARRASGEWVWLEGRGSLIHDETGKLSGMVSVLRDITARKALEEKLRRGQAEAEAAVVAKSEFLANMSHEIRTPLTAIIGFGGLLERVKDLPPTAEKFVSRITTASQTLLSVVNDVLDFSKIEAGQIVLDSHPFDPNAFVAETLGLVEGQAAGKRLRLKCDIGAEVPAAVDADSSRIRQVLLNLLSNAIKFTHHGSIGLSVGYLPDEGGQLRFSVTDTGVGIPRDRLGVLFERFSQVDGSTTRQYGGTGLGLAICKGLAEFMGGTMGVESEEAAGSTFWFTVNAPKAELDRAMFTHDEPDFSVAPARILIVDDVSTNRELVRTMLSPFGHDMTDAASGLGAVEAAMRKGFDLILMDLQMPGMDGLAATRAIRKTCELNRITPIVAISANVLPAHRDACREAGMDDHIAKPIDPAELLTKVTFWSSQALAKAC